MGAVNMTLKEIANQTGEKYNTVYRRISRKYPETSWKSDMQVPDEIALEIVGVRTRTVSLTDKTNFVNFQDGGHDVIFKSLTGSDKSVTSNKAPRTASVTQKGQLQSEVSNKSRITMRGVMLTVLLIAPTAASVGNMYNVTSHITGEHTTALLYTIVLSMSALGFTLAGIGRRSTIALAVLLIGYESFCNITRIYYGLMGGVKGNPIRFLGTVTEIFNTGSYGTAIVIAVFSALLLAAVQYSAIYELSKTKSDA